LALAYAYPAFCNDLFRIRNGYYLKKSAYIGRPVKAGFFIAFYV
jgi:hypothetical protein